jgi:hypothetical protein
MQKITKDIEELKDRVARERVVRQHKEEYALLAKQVSVSLPVFPPLSLSFFLSLSLTPTHPPTHTHTNTRTFQ